MIIFVIKDGTTRKIKLDINVRSTIFDLKANISREMYIKVSEQRLFFNDSELENEKTLESYNITAFTSLRVKCRSSKEGKQVTSHKDQTTPLEREISVVNEQIAVYEPRFGGVEPHEIFRTLNMAALDNGTMVEAFKYLNYCQLAKKSLVSKRFRNLIQTHRHKLPLLYVDDIRMVGYQMEDIDIHIVNNYLSVPVPSSNAYNDWATRNGYSKQVQLENQVARENSPQNFLNSYLLNTYAYYKDLSHRQEDDITAVFSAYVKFTDDNWPVFQHFVRLVTDPFIYIGSAKLSYPNDFLNLLAGAINPDRSHLQCEELTFKLRSTSSEFITWTKNHVRCNQFCIYGELNLNLDEALRDFERCVISTGGHWTTAIELNYCDLSKTMIDFVQMFLNLENWDEYQGIQCIRSYDLVKHQDIRALKNDYANFIVKEEHLDNRGSTKHFLEFANNAIGKKLQLLANPFDDEDDYEDFGAFCLFSLEIINL